MNQKLNKDKARSPRQELRGYAGSGNLRYAMQRTGICPQLSESALQLLVDLVMRYCEPRRRKRIKL